VSRLRTSPRGLAATAAVICAAAGLLGVPGTATADPIGDARARAAALAETVDRLETRAEIAIEQYNAVQERLGRAVVRQSLAERQAEADAGAADAAAQQVADRVRALYAAGGRASLFATVLDGHDPAEAMAGLHLVGAVLEVDASDLEAARQVSDQAAGIADDLTDAATRVTRLQQEASRAAERVRGLLAAQRASLESATSEVRRLMEERRAALAAASAADFLAAAGGSFPPGVSVPEGVAGAIDAARSRLGAPYVWGATGPNSFDCSGLTQWAYAHVGIGLPRVAADQYNAGPHVAINDLLPGDLLFWADDVSDPRTIHHVAIYLGAGMMLAAPHTGDVVKIQPVYLSGYIGATRPYSTSS
jgi:cell wall-associated NlpC family hydrolase